MTIFDFDNFPIPGRTTRTNKDTTRTRQGKHQTIRLRVLLRNITLKVPLLKGVMQKAHTKCSGWNLFLMAVITLKIQLLRWGGGLVFMGRGESGHVIEIRTPQEIKSIEFVIIEFRALKLGGTHGTSIARTCRKWVCCRRHRETLCAGGSAAHSKASLRARSTSQLRICSYIPEKCIALTFLYKILSAPDSYLFQCF